jgi:hypothetical protein
MVTGAAAQFAIDYQYLNDRTWPFPACHFIDFSVS